MTTFIPPSWSIVACFSLIATMAARPALLAADEHGQRMIRLRPKQSIGIMIEQSREGVCVICVDPGGPGHLGGLRAGDVITRIDDNRAVGPAQVVEAVAQVNSGQQPSRVLTIHRRGESSQFTILGATAESGTVAAARWAFEGPRCLRAAAKQGLANAQYSLGRMFAAGEGVAQDRREANRWYRESAEQGHALAQFELCAAHAEGKAMPVDYAAAFRWCHKAAEQGLPQAQITLGNFYRQALGVRQDHVAAVRWYRRAAEQGVAEGTYQLAGMYKGGAGVGQDMAEALRLYREAANQGHSGAQLAVGGMYERGEGVPKDPVKAYMWYTLSASRGEQENEGFRLFRDIMLSGLAEKMTPQQIAEGKKRAQQWKPKPPGRRPANPVVSCGTP